MEGKTVPRTGGGGGMALADGIRAQKEGLSLEGGECWHQEKEKAAFEEEVLCPARRAKGS